MPERETGPDAAGFASFGASAWRVGCGWRVSTGNGRQGRQQDQAHALVPHGVIAGLAGGEAGLASFSA